MIKVHINEFLEGNTNEEINFIESKYGLFQQGNRYYILDREECDFIERDLTEDEASEYLREEREK